MYQIAPIEFQKCNFLVLQGSHIHPQTPPCPCKGGTWCWCSTLVTAFTALPPPGEKQSWICLCLSFVSFMLGLLKKLFMQNTTYVNLLLFLECASRLEHVGLNKYFWHIYKVPMTCFTTRHIQRGGGGGWGQHFSTLRAPKLMTHWAPRVFDLLDTPLICMLKQCYEKMKSKTNVFLFLDERTCRIILSRLIMIMC